MTLPQDERQARKRSGEPALGPALLSSVAHELRSRAGAMLGFVQLVLEDETLDSTQRERLLTVDRSGRRLLALVEDLRQLARLRSGRSAAVASTFSPLDVVRVAVDALRPSASARGLTLELHPSGVPAHVAGDGEKVEVIVHRLVEVAIEGADCGPVAVTVGHRAADGRLTLDVDEPFAAPAEGAPAPPPIEASGERDLRVALARGYAELLGGALEVRPRPWGVSFHLELPVRPTGPPAEPEVGASAPGGAIPRPVEPVEEPEPSGRDGEAVILVVDDDLANLRLLGRMLGDRGYVVRPVSRGDRAVEAAEATAPDAILLDVSMPRMNGFEVCARLKAHPGLRGVPVIFLSGLTDSFDKVRGFQVGGVDYITKPFEIEEVEARLQTHLKLRRLQVELERQNTRLRETVEALERVESLRDNLIHMIVHDMRSPLTGLVGHLQFLALGADGSLDEEQRSDLDAALKASDKLMAMVDSLLDVHRLESGQMPLQIGPCDVSTLAREALELLRRVDPSVPLRLTTPPAPVTGRCDAGLIGRVITNLVDNALKYSPRGEVVEVAIETPKEVAVRVTVRDRGPGVPEASRERIFEKFAQVDPGRRLQRRASGLGLAFCRLAVEAHGGTIGVEEAPGGGSMFWFCLPR